LLLFGSFFWEKEDFAGKNLGKFLKRHPVFGLEVTLFHLFKKVFLELRVMLKSGKFMIGKILVVILATSMLKGQHA